MQRLILAILAVSMAGASVARADDAMLIPKGARVYLAPMDGFETYLAAAIIKKDVPVSVVARKESAQFAISGNSETVKSGWVKALVTGGARADSRGSIMVTNLRTGLVVYAYAVEDEDGGKQSIAESCAKHLKKRIEKGK
jgi:hypothetical protein